MLLLGFGGDTIQLRIIGEEEALVDVPLTSIAPAIWLSTLVTGLSSDNPALCDLAFVCIHSLSAFHNNFETKQKEKKKCVYYRVH